MCVLFALAINVDARCNMTNVDDNSRIVSLAQDFANQANDEFKQNNALRGCELLKISRSFIKQSDNHLLTADISSLFEKKCSDFSLNEILTNII